MLYLKQTITVYDYVIVKQVFLLFFENDGRNEEKKGKRIEILESYRTVTLSHSKIPSFLLLFCMVIENQSQKNCILSSC
jgi:hypothetical protein